jgi:hypothetical protein
MLAGEHVAEVGDDRDDEDGNAVVADETGETSHQRHACDEVTTEQTAPHEA